MYIQSDLTSSKRECKHHLSVCEALQEQIKSEGLRSGKLKEENRTLTNELKTLNERSHDHHMILYIYVVYIHVCKMVLP